MKRFIYLISDSVLEAAEQVAKIGLSQFEDRDYEIKRYAYTTDEQVLNHILKEINKENSLVIYSFVRSSLIEIIEEYVNEHGILAYDVLSGMLRTLSGFFMSSSKNEPNLVQILDKAYFKKAAAVEFAVKYDDGKDTRGIKKADLVLIGISRTSKTPLSMYMAYKNLKVANIPLVPEVPLPKELFEIDPRKIICLISTPEKLNEIRTERLKNMGLGANSDYASIARIKEELLYAFDIMSRIGCEYVDVSNKAVEESAAIIFRKADLFKKINI